ncbi:MAG: alpha/beta fold hydrolase, partial [Acidimicrobiales bacterium]
MTITSPIAPGIPPGRQVDLAGRGSAFTRVIEGPPGAPTLLLLHGWTVTADVNWGPSYAGLAEHFSVLTLDQRGHGGGIHSRRPFTLEDCADDAVALARVAGRDQVIMVGYSMGGPVAQLAWHRHPEVVSGLVLCSTATSFGGGELFYSSLLALSHLARIAPRALSRPLASRFAQRRFAGLTMSEWAAEQVAPNDPAVLLRAGSAIGAFDSAPWISEVDVPTSVVLTTLDRVVEPPRQRALAREIPGAQTFEVAGDHGVCLVDPARYLPVLVEACQSVAARGRGKSFME